MVHVLVRQQFTGPTATTGRGSDEDRDEGDDGDHPYLTKRDQPANTLEDLFDFDRSPSLNAQIGTAVPPATDCTPQ